jgi:ABC-2 type transport system permease protein
MKAFTALLHRELIEHRGAFLLGPLLLVALLFGATILAFTVGRVDARFSGALFTVAPLRVFEVGFLGFGLGWSLYMISVLFFYCADGFAADKRNNAMLFWKSMPVSDFKVLMSKLTAGITILPGTIYGVALLSGLLLFSVAFVTMLINGTATLGTLGSIVGIYGQVALAILVVIACGLLWYLPVMALVGAIATAIGRWAIPVALLLPALLSTLEWVTLGGLHPFDTRTWRFVEYRGALPDTPYLETWFTSERAFSGVDFAADLIASMDWLQVGIGAVFAVVVIYLASEYRRRVNDN